MTTDTTKTIRAFRSTLRRLERHITTNLRENSLCCGVTPTQCHVLLRVEETEETTIAGLTEYLGLDKSSLSRTVDGLVRIGLLERSESQIDRRYSSIRLSSRGGEYLRQLNHVCDDYYAPILSALPPEIRNRLSKDLDALCTAFEEIDQTPEGRSCCSIDDFLKQNKGAVHE